MVIPCLVYLASVGALSGLLTAEVDTLIDTADIAIGIVNTYERSGLKAFDHASEVFFISYLAVSLSLNVLLTLMIVVRLTVHIRDV